MRDGVQGQEAGLGPGDMLDPNLLSRVVQSSLWLIAFPWFCTPSRGSQDQVDLMGFPFLEVW